jgi:hypothetical protein
MLIGLNFLLKIVKIQLLSQSLHFDRSLIGWNFLHRIVLNFYLKAGLMISVTTHLIFFGFQAFLKSFPKFTIGQFEHTF